MTVSADTSAWLDQIEDARRKLVNAITSMEVKHPGIAPDARLIDILVRDMSDRVIDAETTPCAP